MPMIKQSANDKTKKGPAFILTGCLLTFLIMFAFVADAQAKPTIHALLVIMDGDPLLTEQYQKSGLEISHLLGEVKDTVCNLKLTKLHSNSDNVSQWPTNDRILQWIREVRPQKRRCGFYLFLWTRW